MPAYRLQYFRPAIAVAMHLALYGLILVVLVVVVHRLRLNPLLALAIRTEPIREHIRPVPHLFLCSHDYEHVDLIAMGIESNAWKLITDLDSTLVVADRAHNTVYDICASKNAKCLRITGNTVQKVTRMLEDGHVCVFLYRDSTATGIFHMIQNHVGPCMMIRVKSDAAICSGHEVGSCLYNTWGSTYTIEYEPIAKAELPSCSKRAMQYIKWKMYR